MIKAAIGWRDEMESQLAGALLTSTMIFSGQESGLQTNPLHRVQSVATQLSRLLDEVNAGVDTDAIRHALRLVIDDLEAIATTDSVTGALSRRGLLEKLDAELDRANRTGHPFSFAVIAIDQYHSLNAQYGSAISDQVLKNLAQAVLSLIRSLDSFGRLSPNGFALILPTTWLDQSDVAIARLTSAVSILDWGSIALSAPITFSTGLTTNIGNDTAGQMIARASQALVLAQAKGPGSSVQLEQGLPEVDSGS